MSWRHSWSNTVWIVLIVMSLVSCNEPRNERTTVPTASQVADTLPPATSPTPSSVATPSPSITVTPFPSPTKTSTHTPTYTPSPTPPPDFQSYYVDSEAGSDANTGTSPEEAWQTLTPVQSYGFMPGDVIHLKTGSLWVGELVIDDSGTPERPVTFTTYGSGEKPVIENPGGRSGVRITGSWVILEDLLVHDVVDAGVTLAGDHNVVRNMEITDVGMGIAVRSRYNVVDENYIHDLHMVRNTPGGDDDYGAVGVWLFDSDNEVSHNLMVNCRAPSYDYGIDGGGVEIFGENVNTSYIHHNWISDSAGGMEIGGGSARNHTIAYNVFVDNAWVLAAHLGGEHASIIEGIRFEHNVVVETHDHDRPLFSFIRGNPTPDTLALRNNIVYVLTGSVADHDTFIHQHNLYYLGDNARLGFGLGEQELIAQPRFVDLDARDFRLQPRSPAIDAGLDLGYTSDFEGEPVPVAGSPESEAIPDLGAFEYQADAGTSDRTDSP